VGVRALTVWFDRDEWGLMQEDDGSQRIANLATRDRVWLDERTDAFRWRRRVEPDRPAALVSVFDGTRAAARYGSGAGPQLIGYEGTPEVVARLAGWISVDVARAHVAGARIPRGFRVDEPDVAPPDNVFELPGGTQARMWRQLDGIPPDAYSLGDVWAGQAPDFAASLTHLTGERRQGTVVVYPGVCVLTSERRSGDGTIGSQAAVGRTRRDGSFGIRPPRGGTTVGFIGYELALAGVGTHGLVVETERHTVVVTGAAVGADAATEIAPSLRSL
jgi:hypothetical protein